MSKDEDKQQQNTIEEWTYDVTPKRIMFALDFADGVRYLALDAATWEKLTREFDSVVHKAKPITDNELTNLLQAISNMRGNSKPHLPPVPLVNLVNVARRADGQGYILRLYEPRNDREWIVSTLGEYEAMERTVRNSNYP